MFEPLFRRCCSCSFPLLSSTLSCLLFCPALHDGLLRCLLSRTLLRILGRSSFGCGMGCLTVVLCRVAGLFRACALDRLDPLSDSLWSGLVVVVVVVVESELGREPLWIRLRWYAMRVSTAAKQGACGRARRSAVELTRGAAPERGNVCGQGAAIHDE